MKQYQNRQQKRQGRDTFKIVWVLYYKREIYRTKGWLAFTKK